MKLLRKIARTEGRRACGPQKLRAVVVGRVLSLAEEAQIPQQIFVRDDAGHLKLKEAPPSLAVRPLVLIFAPCRQRSS